MMPTLAVFSCLLRALASSVQLDSTRPALQSIFEPSPGTCYRIPAVAAAPDGMTTLIAAERRRPTCDDFNTTHDLVLVRVSPNGTAGEVQVLLDTGDAWYNPTFAVDRVSNTTHMLINRTPYALNNPEDLICGNWSRDTFILSSIDSGATWGPARNISDQVQPAGLGWRSHSVGPGAGVQLDSGRLVVPAYHFLCNDTLGDTDAELSGTFLSDDGGATWRVGGLSPSNRTNEAQAAVLSNGTVALYSRMNRPCDGFVPALGFCRGASLSSDGGQSFTQFRVVQDLIDPACEGSIVAHEPTGTLWYSLAYNRVERVDVSVLVSHDQGSTWSVSHTLVQGPSGYSQMAVLPPGQAGNFTGDVLGVVFENGNNGTISLARVPIV